MNRLALFVLAGTVALIGCGGGGGGVPGGGGGNGGGGGGPVLSSVNTSLLNRPAMITVTYNTGQGRAEGSPTVLLSRLYVQDNSYSPALNPLNRPNVDLNPMVALQLDGYTSQDISLSAVFSGFSVPINSRTFSTFTLDVQGMQIEDDQGNLGSIITGNGGNPLVLETFDQRVRAFPGRHTNMEVFLDDATLNHDGANVVFDRPRFEDINYDPTTGKMMGHLSDFIMFDISNVANKPQLTSSEDATRVYFTGDTFAISLDPTPTGDKMEVLTPVGFREARVTSQPTQFPADGTWTVRQIDPRDLTNTARITALQGIWRPAIDADPTRSMLLNVGAYEVVLFPNSDEDGLYDMAMFTQSGGNINNFYFGQANLNNNTFAAWPVSEIDEGSPSGEINGTLSALVFRSVPSPTNRDVRSGAINVTAGTSPFPATGRFIVLRP